MIHEFPELPDDKVDKIKAVNLTLHYETMLVKNSLKVWERNALVLVDRIHNRGIEMLMGTIMSPLITEYWEEALQFYEKAVFKETGKKIVLIRDVNRPLSDSQERQLNDLEQRFDHLVERVHQEDFAKNFTAYKNVLCPAGKIYFRVWNDGRIEGCPYIPALRDAGNVKNRDIRVRDELFRCNQARYCDCNVIARLGKMGYES